eukprot:GGOE01037389.1.p1 GENE.GGOE01037389.1~~GGOE01037389.1.p1  ORF type:complete len:144 (+),score=2.54 GGOE01037389.1:177-608(+)
MAYGGAPKKQQLSAANALIAMQMHVDILTEPKAELLLLCLALEPSKPNKSGGQSGGRGAKAAAWHPTQMSPRVAQFSLITHRPFCSRYFSLPLPCPALPSPSPTLPLSSPALCSALPRPPTGGNGPLLTHGSNQLATTPRPAT